MLKNSLAMKHLTVYFMLVNFPFVCTSRPFMIIYTSSDLESCKEKMSFNLTTMSSDSGVMKDFSRV